jgi:hypothetical protein
MGWDRVGDVIVDVEIWLRGGGRKEKEEEGIERESERKADRKKDVKEERKKLREQKGHAGKIISNGRCFFVCACDRTAQLSALSSAIQR